MGFNYKYYKYSDRFAIALILIINESKFICLSIHSSDCEPFANERGISVVKRKDLSVALKQTTKTKQ